MSVFSLFVGFLPRTYFWPIILVVKDYFLAHIVYIVYSHNSLSVFHLLGYWHSMYFSARQVPHWKCTAYLIFLHQDSHECYLHLWSTFFLFVYTLFFSLKISCQIFSQKLHNKITFILLLMVSKGTICSVESQFL